MLSDDEIDDFLTHKPVKKKQPIVEVVVPVVQTSTVKIPANEKKWSSLFAKPLESPKVVLGDDEPDSFYASFMGFLSKNPTFIYLYYTKSVYFKKKQFAFKDTKRNITIILTKEEISKKIRS